MRTKNAIFKPSSSTNNRWNLLKTVSQTMLFWFIFLYLTPSLLKHTDTRLGIPNFSPLPVIGWLGFIVFGSLGLYSGYTMSQVGKGTPLPIDCPNKLVIVGPYKWVRNPMAVAGIGQGICVGLILGSFSVIIYAFSGAILWHLFVRPSEERDLAERFGDDYRTYKSNIKCWIPYFTIIKNIHNGGKRY